MNYLIFLALVALPITIMSLFFQVGKNSGGTVLQRPPSYMFGIVWFILYLLIARSWWLVQDHLLAHYLYGSLVILLALWLVCYHYDKRYGLWCLMLGTTLALGTMTWTMTISTDAGFTLLPLVGWTFFATMLNFREIDTTST